MTWIATVSWIALALIHLAPAAVAFAPNLAGRLHGVDVSGNLEVLLTHRGVLFLAIVALCLFSAFDQQPRKAASMAVAISVIGFLVVYGQAGAPAGPLRTIALVDVAALPFLAIAGAAAWRHS